MAFVGGRFEAADLLLSRVEALGEFFLRDAGMLAQPGNLQRHILCFAGGFEALCEIRVAELLLQKAIEVDPGHLQARTLSPLTRLNSRTLAVTKVASRLPGMSGDEQVERTG
ncbi:MAG: hypothetical protein ACREIF_11160 [Chthoniobacterales bacterium]